MTSNNNFFQIRKATEADLLSVYNLSNDPHVRSASFNSATIELADHKKWFKKKLSDQNHLFLICEFKKTFAGQIRFEVDSQKNEATISISIASNYIGKGLGQQLMRAGISYLKSEFPKVKTIKALIKATNVSSIKYFEKMNFTLLNKTTINGYYAFEYQLIIKQ